ncbi:uncharacterized protein LOC131678070 [Topomyia yanbarensis]|uniref:uncharacterized protein LOC131678070 n=1 Tax=Topomyia yanbarensis TaxID=2498891 RepID=UPI00273B886A|nr:uncharacterized protein LOC131678070 [Topomyia yanbarensis]XP_058814192.1 uncharacterized protein LOC131678070 [Topomyia yanbarensis]
MVPTIQVVPLSVSPSELKSPTSTTSSQGAVDTQFGVPVIPNPISNQQNPPCETRASTDTLSTPLQVTDYHEREGAVGGEWPHPTLPPPNPPTQSILMNFGKPDNRRHTLPSNMRNFPLNQAFEDVRQEDFTQRSLLTQKVDTFEQRTPAGNPVRTLYNLGETNHVVQSHWIGGIQRLPIVQNRVGQRMLSNQRETQMEDPAPQSETTRPILRSNIREPRRSPQNPVGDEVDMNEYIHASEIESYIKSYVDQALNRENRTVVNESAVDRLANELANMGMNARFQISPDSAPTNRGPEPVPPLQLLSSRQQPRNTSYNRMENIVTSEPAWMPQRNAGPPLTQARVLTPHSTEERRTLRGGPPIPPSAEYGHARR